LRVTLAVRMQSFAAVGHCVFRVDDQIHDDLLELTGVGASAADVGSKLSGEFDIFADEGAQQALHVGDDRVDVDDFEFEKLLAAECKELTGESRGHGWRPAEWLPPGAKGMALAKLAEKDLGVAADDHEQIVEVVSDAAGEAAERLPFSGPAELIFENAARGDVFGDGFEDVGGFVAASDGAATEANGDDDAVLALPADFKAVNAASAAELVDQLRVFAGFDEDIFLRIEGEHFGARSCSRGIPMRAGFTSRKWPSRLER